MSAWTLRGWALASALGVVFALYTLAGVLGLSLAVVSPQVSPVWPPTAVALAAVLLLGYRVWPAVAAGALAVNYQSGAPLEASLAIAAGNTLEAVAGVWLLRRAGFRGTMDSLRDVLLLAGLAAGVSTAISATIGVGSLWAAGRIPTELTPGHWWTWWIGDAMGNLVFAPLLLTVAAWAQRGSVPGRAGEAAAVLLATGVAALLIFVSPLGTHGTLSFLIAPLLVWSALRLEQVYTAAAVVLVAAVAIWGLLRGSGEVAAEALNQRLLMMQTFVGVASVSSLALGAASAARRRTEWLLRGSEARLRMAVEAGRMGTWEWEIASGRVQWSPGLEAIHGLSPGEFPGTFEYVCGETHPEDRALLQARVAEALAGGAPYQVEYRIVRRDGGTRWVEGRGTVVRDAEGRPVRMIGVCADITARKDSERLLATKAAALERSNADLEDFAYAASHDLKEPLRGISGYATMVLEDSAERLDEKARERLRSIGHLTTRMDGLISALLEYSRLGRTELAVADVDLAEVVREVLEALRPRLEQDRVEVSVGALPTVRCDRFRTQQVFANLVSNGCKYNDKEARRIEIGAVNGALAGAGGGAGPVLFVRDNGIGIPDRHLGKLFRMFKRLHARDAFGGGTGAGLAIVKSIVERHGGRVWCESVPGDGSTFYFTLGPGETRPAGGEGGAAIRQGPAAPKPDTPMVEVRAVNPVVEPASPGGQGVAGGAG
ncbi:MAG: MASE1 domain-containing protein [Phycisphaerales bacterium]